MPGLIAPLASILLLATPALAEKRVAIVIGNDKYANLPTLQKAVNDAESVGDALAKLGFDVVRGRDLGRQGMVDKIAEFTAKIAPGDIAVFFYAGHGVGINNVNYLVPVDVPAANVEARVRGGSIAEGDIVAEIQDKGARVAMLVLDACRDNPFPRTGTRTVGNTRGLASTTPASGVFVLYSAGAGQTALDRLQKNDPHRNGVFTRVFVEHLTKPDLHLGDLAVEVREQVAVLARQSLDDAGQPAPHVQTPAYYDQTIGGRVYLAGRGIAVEPGGTTAPPAADPCAFAADHWRSAEAIGTASALQDHLARFPNCAFAGLARSKLAALDRAPAQPPALRPIEPPPARTQQGATPIPAVEWRIASGFLKIMPSGFDEFVSRLSRNSGERMKLTPFYAGQLMPAFQTADAVQSGQVDAGFLPGQFLIGKDKALNLMSVIPFGFGPREHVAWRQRKDVAGEFEFLLSRAYPKLVSMPCGGFGRLGELWSRKPLRDVSDVKGLKVVVLGIGGDVYRAAGASVVVLPTSELYSALERGVVDAVHAGSPRLGESMGMNRVAKFLYNPAFVMPAMVVDLFVNRDKWDQLPPAARDLVQKTCDENVQAVIAENEAADQEALKRIAAGGVSIQPMPPAIRSALLNAALKVEGDYAAAGASAQTLIRTIQAMRGKTLAAQVR